MRRPHRMPVGPRSKTKHALRNALAGLRRLCRLALCSEFRGRPLLFCLGDKLRIDVDMPPCELKLFLPNDKSALLDCDLVISRF